MSFADLTATQKEELVTSLAILAIHDAKAEISAENISAAVKASGNSVAAYVPQLFADLIGRGLKVDKFLAGPSAGTSSIHLPCLHQCMSCHTSTSRHTAQHSRDTAQHSTHTSVSSAHVQSRLCGNACDCVRKSKATVRIMTRS